MYQVKIYSKEIIRFDTKEDLILYFARREPITLGLWSESKLLSYIPKLFDQVAMNPNDRYTLGVTGRALHGDFWRYGARLDTAPRTIMVYEDGRVVDIWDWLPEFRACLIGLKNKTLGKPSCSTCCAGRKPRCTKQYRIAQGYRQSQAGMSEADEEDVLDTLGYVPSKMKHRSGAPSSIRPKDSQRSWKANSKARKSWGRHKAASSQESIRMIGQEEINIDLEYEDGILDALFLYGDGWDQEDA